MNTSFQVELTHTAADVLIPLISHITTVIGGMALRVTTEDRAQMGLIKVRNMVWMGKEDRGGTEIYSGVDGQRG